MPENNSPKPNTSPQISAEKIAAVPLRRRKDIQVTDGATQERVDRIFASLDEQSNVIKTVFDAKTGELLGAHMIGAEVTELIQGYVIGRSLETTEEDLMNTVFPHPTLSEMMHESVLDAYGRALHI